MNTSGLQFPLAKRALMLSGLLCALLALASCSSDLLVNGMTNSIGYSKITDSQPSRLRIPSLGMDAPIIPVGEDRYGAMEAPGAGHPASDPIWATAFWWKQGPTPGQPGNAVLAGHVDRNDGSRAVFWNLPRIRTGDHIVIINQSGQTLTFQVTDVEAFASNNSGPNDPVIQRVFGPATTANLNLITCYGSWIGTQYNKRLVVFSTLIATA
jgi:LPXTG-site transpeptidase (sortase) family protein